MENKIRTKRTIIKTQVDIITMSQCCETIIDWINNKKSKYISTADTHVIVRSWIDCKYRNIINSSDITTPDGAPLAWVLRLLGFKDQRRLPGPDLMENLLPILEKKRLKILFYGSTNKVLSKISKRIKKKNPHLEAYFISPPFRNRTFEEDKSNLKFIKDIKPDLIFVGLGAPKQDFWIYKNKSKINSVFIGVGAAFDFYARTVSRAPIFMQNNGLEWLYRIYKEPRRLFFRYFFSIILFFIGFSIQFVFMFLSRL